VPAAFTATSAAEHSRADKAAQRCRPWMAGIFR